MDEYINFGDVCRNRLSMQSQTGMYYFLGLADRPEMGNGLRIRGDWNFWHSVEIHKDDADEFVRRVKEYMMEGFY